MRSSSCRGGPGPFAVGLIAAAAVAVASAQSRTIDDFFRDFTAEWVRANPNIAASTRYFPGPEQRQFERQLTPLTREHLESRVSLARKGLADLRRFDPGDSPEVLQAAKQKTRVGPSHHPVSISYWRAGPTPARAVGPPQRLPALAYARAGASIVLLK